MADFAAYLKSIDVQIDDIPAGITLNGEYTSLTKYDKVVEREDNETKENFYYSESKTAPYKKSFTA